MPRLGIALGSNIGDRLHALRRARDELLAAAGPQADFRQAPIFASAPVDCPPGSPDFFNTALEMDFAQDDPGEILALCQALEGRLGRAAAAGRTRNAPRTIDIDLLYGVGAACRVHGLELPHPRLGDRAFVLVPLACIAPERVPGGWSISVREALARLPDPGAGLSLAHSDW